MHSPTGHPDRTPKLEECKQEIWARSLVGIPTTIGRLVYLASLRDEITGSYRGSGLAGDGSATEIDLPLRQIHEEVFRTWLSFSLADQREEVELHLTSVKDERVGDLGTWLNLAAYLDLIPNSAEGAERELYRSDLEMVLELLKDQFKGS